MIKLKFIKKNWMIDICSFKIQMLRINKEFAALMIMYSNVKLFVLFFSNE